MTVELPLFQRLARLCCSIPEPLQAMPVLPPPGVLCCLPLLIHRWHNCCCINRQDPDPSCLFPAVTSVPRIRVNFIASGLLGPSLPFSAFLPLFCSPVRFCCRQGCPSQTHHRSQHSVLLELFLHSPPSATKCSVLCVLSKPSTSIRSLPATLPLPCLEPSASSIHFDANHISFLLVKVRKTEERHFLFL